MTTQRSISIVDDEFGLAEMLREYGYDVMLAINGRRPGERGRQRVSG